MTSPRHLPVVAALCAFGIFQSALAAPGPQARQLAFSRGVETGLSAAPAFLRELAGMRPWPITTAAEVRAHPDFHRWSDHRRMSYRDLGFVFTMKRALEHMAQNCKKLGSKADASLVGHLSFIEMHLNVLTSDLAAVLPDEFRRRMIVAADAMERRFEQMESTSVTSQGNSFHRAASFFTLKWPSAAPLASRSLGIASDDLIAFDDGLVAALSLIHAVPTPGDKDGPLPRRRVWWGLPWNTLWRELRILRGEKDDDDAVFMIDEENDDTFERGRMAAAQRLSESSTKVMDIIMGQLRSRSQINRQIAHRLVVDAQSYFNGCKEELLP